MTEEERYAAAWQDRPRRLVLFRTMQIALIPMMIGLIYLYGSRRATLLNASVVVLIPLCLYGIVGVWLNRFRCPRCGGLYYWNPRRRGYLQRQRAWRDCRHCGLKQDTLYISNESSS
jgi:hypothetical protein